MFYQDRRLIVSELFKKNKKGYCDLRSRYRVRQQLRPCGLSPLTDGMPVIPTNSAAAKGHYAIYHSSGTWGCRFPLAGKRSHPIVNLSPLETLEVVLTPPIHAVRHAAIQQPSKHFTLDSVRLPPSGFLPWSDTSSCSLYA